MKFLRKYFYKYYVKIKTHWTKIILPSGAEKPQGIDLSNIYKNKKIKGVGILYLEEERNFKIESSAIKSIKLFSQFDCPLRAKFYFREDVVEILTRDPLLIERLMDTESFILQNINIIKSKTREQFEK